MALFNVVYEHSQRRIVEDGNVYRVYEDKGPNCVKKEEAVKAREAQGFSTDFNGVPKNGNATLTDINVEKERYGTLAGLPGEMPDPDVALTNTNGVSTDEVNDAINDQSTASPEPLISSSNALNLESLPVEIPQAFTEKSGRHTDNLAFYAEVLREVDGRVDGEVSKLKQNVDHSIPQEVVSVISRAIEKTQKQTNFQWNEDDFRDGALGDAEKFSRKLKNYTVFQHRNPRPNIFEATSILIYGTDEFASVLQMATFVEMKNDAKLVAKCSVCKTTNSEALKNIFQSQGYSKPLTIHYLANVVKRNILYNVTTFNKEKIQIKFGNFHYSRNINVLEFDLSTFPLLPPVEAGSSREIYIVGFPLLPISRTRTPREQTANQHIRECQKFFNMICEHCSDFNIHNCEHIEDTQRIGADWLQALLLNDYVGFTTIKDYSKADILKNSQELMSCSLERDFVLIERSAGTIFDALSYGLLKDKSLSRPLRLGIVAAFSSQPSHTMSLLSEKGCVHNNSNDIIMSVHALQETPNHTGMLLFSRFVSRKINIWAKNGSSNERKLEFDFDSQMSRNFPEINILYFGNECRLLVARDKPANSSSDLDPSQLQLVPYTPLASLSECPQENVNNSGVNQLNMQVTSASPVQTLQVMHVSAPSGQVSLEVDSYKPDILETLNVYQFKRGKKEAEKFDNLTVYSNALIKEIHQILQRDCSSLASNVRKFLDRTTFERFWGIYLKEYKPRINDKSFKKKKTTLSRFQGDADAMEITCKVLRLCCIPENIISVYLEHAKDIGKNLKAKQTLGKAEEKGKHRDFPEYVGEFTSTNPGAHILPSTSSAELNHLQILNTTAADESNEISSQLVPVGYYNDSVQVSTMTKEFPLLSAPDGFRNSCSNEDGSKDISNQLVPDDCNNTCTNKEQTYEDVPSQQVPDQQVPDAYPNDDTDFYNTYTKLAGIDPLNFQFNLSGFFYSCSLPSTAETQPQDKVQLQNENTNVVATPELQHNSNNVVTKSDGDIIIESNANVSKSNGDETHELPNRSKSQTHENQEVKDTFSWSTCETEEVQNNESGTTSVVRASKKSASNKNSNNIIHSSKYTFDSEVKSAPFANSQHTTSKKLMAAKANTQNVDISEISEDATNTITSREQAIESLKLPDSVVNFQPSKHFAITIPARAVRNMFDRTTEKFIPRRWAPVFGKQFKRVHGCCSFTPTHTVRYNTTTYSAFARMYGTCKCKLTFKITVLNKPRSGKNLRMTVSAFGDFKLIQSICTSRQVRGNDRLEAYKKLKHMKAGKLYTLSNAKTPILQRLHNNVQYPSLSALQNMRSEIRHLDSTSKLLTEDIHNQKTTLATNDTLSSTIKGYIQHCHLDPGELHVHMYTESSMRLLMNAQRGNKAVMTFDATGSVVNHYGGKQTLLYVGLMTDQEGKTFPVFEALSQRGRALEISNIFNHIRTDIVRINPGFNKPLAAVTVVDFSLANLNAVAQGVNLQRLKDYLKLCFEVLHNKVEFDQDRSVIFICTAHLIHSFSRWLSNTLPNKPEFKPIRKLALTGLARLQETKNLNEYILVVNALCNTFATKHADKKSLDASTAFLSKPIVEELDENFNAADFFDEEYNLDYHQKLKESSMFYVIFKNIRAKYDAQNDAQNDAQTVEKNPHYQPEVLNLIQEYYSQYAPLFSAMMLSETGRHNQSRLTNSRIEGEFHRIKNIIHDEGRLPINEFIRKNLQYHEGRIGDYLGELSEPQKRKFKNIEEQLNSEDIATHPDIVSEAWSRSPQKSANRILAPRVLFKAFAPPKEGIPLDDVANTIINAKGDSEHKRTRPGSSTPKTKNRKIILPQAEVDLIVDKVVSEARDTMMMPPPSELPNRYQRDSKTNQSEQHLTTSDTCSQLVENVNEKTDSSDANLANLHAKRQEILKQISLEKEARENEELKEIVLIKVKRLDSPRPEMRTIKASKELKLKPGDKVQIDNLEATVISTDTSEGIHTSDCEGDGITLELLNNSLEITDGEILCENTMRLADQAFSKMDEIKQLNQRIREDMDREEQRAKKDKIKAPFVRSKALQKLWDYLQSIGYKDPLANSQQNQNGTSEKVANPQPNPKPKAPKPQRNAKLNFLKPQSNHESTTPKSQLNNEPKAPKPIVSKLKKIVPKNLIELANSKTPMAFADTLYGWTLSANEILDFCKDDSWVTTEQMLFMMEYFRTKFSHSNFEIVNPFFVTKALYGSKATWTNTKELRENRIFDKHADRNVDITKECLQVVLYENHWMLLTIDHSTKTCLLADSKPPEHNDPLIQTLLQKSLLDEIRNNALVHFIIDPKEKDQWNVAYHPGIPKQSKMICGLYALLSVETFNMTGTKNIRVEPIKFIKELRSRYVRDMLSTTETGKEVLKQAGDDFQQLESILCKISNNL